MESFSCKPRVTSSRTQQPLISIRKAATVAAYCDLRFSDPLILELPSSGDFDQNKSGAEKKTNHIQRGRVVSYHVDWLLSRS